MDRMADVITCPECGTEIEITEALSSQLGEKLRKEYEAKAREREKQFADREAKLKESEESIGKQREGLEEELAARLKTEREKLREEEAKRAKEQLAVELRDKDSELTAVREKLEAAQQSELDLRKKARELEEAKKELDLTLARKLDEERDKIRQAAKKEADDERQLKDAEKDKIITDLRQQIGDLKRKSEQGSQQLQGEILELTIEDLLAQHFPYDDITPVPKGIHGGDAVQTVRDSTGAECGIILWESKRTKNWSDSWLPKLRDDLREAKAQVAILVSIELPKEVSTFRHIDGVWVTSAACAMSLASAIRAGMIEVATAKKSLEGRNDKMEFLYGYLSGPEFRNRVEGIVEAFMTLREELEREKRSTQRMWARREKQLERAVSQTAGMYGDLSGIIGASLPAIEQLDVPAIDGPETESEDDDGGAK